MAQCVLLETGAKGFWAPNGDDGTGKPGVNHQTHQTNNTTPNFLQLWPFTRTHFHLLIGVLEIICNPWEKFDQESKEVNLRFTSRRFEKIRENELSTHRRCCQLILSAIHCRGNSGLIRSFLSFSFMVSSSLIAFASSSSSSLSKSLLIALIDS